MLYIFFFCFVLYIFANFSLGFWSSFCAPPTTYCRASPSNSISKTLSHIYNLCWLFIYVQKQSRSMIVVISMCSVLMIFFFFFFLRNWMCDIHFLPRTKKELLLLSMLYIFWVSVYVCKGWFGNCKSCSDPLAKRYPPLTLPLQVCVCKGLIIFFVVIFIPTLKPCL